MFTQFTNILDILVANAVEILTLNVAPSGTATQVSSWKHAHFSL